MNKSSLLVNIVYSWPDVLVSDQTRCIIISTFSGLLGMHIDKEYMCYIHGWLKLLNTLPCKLVIKFVKFLTSASITIEYHEMEVNVKVHSLGSKLLLQKATSRIIERALNCLLRIVLNLLSEEHFSVLSSISFRD